MSKTDIDAMEVPEQSKTNSKDMKRFNVYAVIAIVIFALCCGAALVYTHMVDQRLNDVEKRLIDLQSQFENHLLYCNIKKDTIEAEYAYYETEDVESNLLEEKEAEIKNLKREITSLKTQHQKNSEILENEINRLNHLLRQKTSELEKVKQEMQVLKRLM